LQNAASTSDEDFVFLEPLGIERTLATIEIVCTPYFGISNYPEISDKAAAILYFLIIDHYMVDGNKRFAMFVTEYFLQKNGYELKIDRDEYIFIAIVISCSKSRPLLDKLRDYFAITVTPLSIN